MSKKNIFSLIIVLLILVVAGIFIFRSSGGSTVPPGKYDAFGECLASKKLTMYGASWCPHCKAQKALFGESPKYPFYFECTDNPNECIAKGVEGYPTWIDANGQKYVGEQSLEKLSEISGCTLPK